MDKTVRQVYDELNNNQKDILFGLVGHMYLGEKLDEDFVKTKANLFDELTAEQQTLVDILLVWASSTTEIPFDEVYIDKHRAFGVKDRR